MKKCLIIFITIILIISFLKIGKAELIVSPPELSITMDNEFIEGNTSKKITITNNQNDNYNVTWYLDNPYPIEWMRPNKTVIPNLTWIDLNPKWMILPQNNYSDFFIYLSIPKSDEFLNKSWETWVTFKFENLGSGEFFNQEFAVRLYIDTPKAVYDASNQTNIKPNSNQIAEVVIISIGIITIFALIVTCIILTRKPK